MMMVEFSRLRWAGTRGGTGAGPGRPGAGSRWETAPVRTGVRASPPLGCAAPACGSAL